MSYESSTLEKNRCAPTLFLLPMTVDADKFVNANRLECVEPYIACVWDA